MNQPIKGGAGPSLLDQGGPLVSVIIPFYNNREYLRQALKSCVDNTYLNIEVIIVDDFSDESLKLEELKIDLRNRPIHIIRNASNRGPGYSRNVGVKRAKGVLIAFLDSDDIWYPEIIEKQVRVFQSDPQAVWVYTDAYYLLGDKKQKKLNSLYHRFKGGKFPEGREVNEYHLKGHNYMTFSSNMYKKDALIDVGLFNEALEVSEDWDLFVRMAERFSVHVINEPLMLYRVNNEGRHFKNRSGYVDVNIKILEDMYERQGLLPARAQDLELAVAVVYQRAGIQRMNAGLNKEARFFLFHSKTAPLKWERRMICLRILSFLPIQFYNTALWVYDKF